MPDDKPLRDGDIVNIDVTFLLDGWHGDSSRMYVAGAASTKARLLMDVTYEAMMRGIRAVKPELLESISAALGVSVNALKDYGVETAGDLMSLLVRLEDSFGIVPAADGTGLSLNPKAPHAPKAAMAIELWAEKRAQLENGKIDADEYEDWKASL